MSLVEVRKKLGADALRSGRSPFTRVKVQVLSSAPLFQPEFGLFLFLFPIFPAALSHRIPQCTPGTCVHPPDRKSIESARIRFAFWEKITSHPRLRGTATASTGMDDARRVRRERILRAVRQDEDFPAKMIFKTKKRLKKTGIDVHYLDKDYWSG